MDLPRGAVRGEVIGLQDVMPTLLDAAGAPIPDAVDGKSALQLLRGAEGTWREYIHGEHTGAFAMQYLTDGKEKFVWFTQTGQEQFFVLEDDPAELHDRIGDAEVSARISTWRSRMIECLAGRPEGYTDGTQLIAGRKARTVLPHGRADES